MRHCRWRLLTDLLVATAMFLAIARIVVGSPPRKPYVLLQEKDNGASIKITITQTILIEVSRQLGTGYSWRPTQLEESAWRVARLGPHELKLLSDQGILAPGEGDNLPGSAEPQVFRLQPLSKGTSRIEFIYARPWEREKPSKSFGVTVRVTE